MPSISCCDLLQTLLRPREAYSVGTLVARKLTGRDDTTKLKEAGARGFCYRSLKEVSRSFTMVILQLHEAVQDAVCIFYLVLRALDTIEDDMAVPLEKKIPLLLSFHEKLDLTEYSVDGIGAGHEMILLQRYSEVLEVYHTLSAGHQGVIKDITQKMGEGMVKYLTVAKCDRVADYDEYCFYVAGLVGYGLTDLWEVEGHAPKGCGREEQRSMGLFLQKVNIIRDYLEDVTDDPPRCYWPKEIWGEFAESNMDFAKAEHLDAGVRCLNKMVEDALRHVPDCVKYLEGLGEPHIFAFCAIPQAMAMATLCEVYNNPLVFKQKVKMRKGATCRIMVYSTDLPNTVAVMREHLGGLRGKARGVAGSGPMAEKIDELLATCLRSR